MKPLNTQQIQDRVSRTNLFAYRYALWEKLFSINGDCDFDNDCVSSKNFPNVYGNYEECEVTIERDVVVTPWPNFQLEECCVNPYRKCFFCAYSCLKT